MTPEGIVTSERGWTWLPWVVAAALFVLWVSTITVWHLKDQLTEAAFLSDTRRDLLQAMQTVGQSLQQLNKEQQALAQRLQALEAAKPKAE
jgi:Tfp pilus assembly protein PilN